MGKGWLWVSLVLGLGSPALVGMSTSLGAEEPQEPALRNIQVLQGMTPREVQIEMVAWNMALGAVCVDCHVQGDFAAETPPLKAVTRNMVRLVNVLNDDPYFRNSNRKADCFMCHQGKKQIRASP